MYLIGGYGTPVTRKRVSVAPSYEFACGGPTSGSPVSVLGYVNYPFISVETAAKVLRMHPKTLYRNLDDVPHKRIGGLIRIHVSFLMFEYVPDPIQQAYDPNYDTLQYEFVYDVPVRSVKRYRTGAVRRVGDYEVSLSNRPWRNSVVS